MNIDKIKKIGDWGLGIGDWGLGIGDWAQSPIPNPQYFNFYILKIKSIKYYFLLLKYLLIK